MKIKKNLHLKNIDDLKDYASNQRSNFSQTLQVPFGLNMYYISDLQASNWTALESAASKENAENIRQIRLPSEVLTTQMTNGQIVSLVGAARNLEQANNDVYKEIIDLINDGTITTEAEVDSNWASLAASYVNIRVLAPTNQQLAVQSDWTQTDSLALDFIKNKPM